MGTRVLHVVAILRRVDRRDGVQIDVAEFEEVPQVVEVVVNLRHLVELLGRPRPFLLRLRCSAVHRSWCASE